ncbi:MAG: Cyclic di-GMP phosphodiesterase response regulator RpfG [candidate division TA06 bacterium ADurb.Bin417]|uniref:Cyclic di-GMP phosphodiesterase response regulator RpfG n=1 Tax=candidate division TA06 bacterium ADurb.Bin417 TaxID=1852828 RepID=A0A1V5MED2_UNCT6|nr:MAG: Cyclic di-GMP phosphodiesterase response regulator RpfG [candidate division TA06 bacterium ADurb.Bin417]
MKLFPAGRRLAVFVLAGLCLIFFFDYLGLFDGTDNYSYDLSFRLRGARHPDPRIVIVDIDEETLDALGRWPFPRRNYAAFLESVREADAVGFDVIMDEPSADDSIFNLAIRQQGRVILPVYFDSEAAPHYPLSAFKPHRTGHIHVEPAVDAILRESFHTLYYQQKGIPSFSSALYETMTDKVMRRGSPSAAVKAEPGRNVIFQVDPTRINFRGPPRTYPYLSMGNVILGDYPSSFFRGKAVLLGASAPGLGDVFTTPFSQHRNRMAGVEVHATMLDNLLNGDSLKVAGDWFRRFLGLFLFFPIFTLLAKSSYRKVGLLWVAGCAIIVLGSLLLFTFARYWIKPTAFFISLNFVFVVAHVCRLDEAAGKLSDKYLSIVSLVGARAPTPPRSRTGLTLPSFLSAEGLNSHIQRLFDVEQQYEGKLQKIIDEKTGELSNALDMLHSMSREIVLRLTSAGEYRDSDTGRHLTRIRLYVKDLSEAMGMSHAFIEEITFTSAMHDIGKIGIPDHILLKPGGLTPEEFEIMKTHTLIGEKILAGSRYPTIQLSARLALCHHEKWDGSGYPHGLKGAAIPLEARIVMICDIYDALRSRRPYKPEFDHSTAFKMITEGDRKTSPDQFDPDVLGAFTRIAAAFEEIYDRHRN